MSIKKRQQVVDEICINAGGRQVMSSISVAHEMEDITCLIVQGQLRPSLARQIAFAAIKHRFMFYIEAISAQRLEVYIDFRSPQADVDESDQFWLQQYGIQIKKQ